jgi:methionyl-tRNA formyltransferase
MRVVFMGTGDIAIPSFERLIGLPEMEVVGLYTQPDRPFGRKLEMHPPEIKKRAGEAGVPVFQPEKLSGREAMAELRGLRPDLIVVMAYGQILRRAVLDLPPMGCLNLHASLLPRHRGASPIQAAIRAGDAETGITVMHVAPALDSGDIILARSLEIRPDETGGSLHDRLADLAPEAMAEALGRIVAGTATREPQDEARATYLGKLGREDGAIDWSRPAEEIERWVRAFDPWPGTYAEWLGQKLKVFPPVGIEEATGAPGEILSIDGGALTVACGSGALRVEVVQIEGRKRLDVRSFLAGQRGAMGPGSQLR